MFYFSITVKPTIILLSAGALCPIRRDRGLLRWTHRLQRSPRIRCTSNGALIKAITSDISTLTTRVTMRGPLFSAGSSAGLVLGLLSS